MSFHPRAAVSALSARSWGLRQNLSFWQSTGIHQVGLPIRTLCESGDEEGTALVRASGLRVVEVSKTNAFDLSHPESWEEAQRELERAVVAAAAVSSPVLYTTTGPAGTLLPDEAAAAFIKAIEPVSRLAQLSGVRLAVEQSGVYSRDSGCVHTLPDVIELVEEADLGLCLELQNCWYERHLEANLGRVAERICVVQVSDSITGTRQALDRAVPGDGDIPLEWFFDKLLGLGYTGPFELEIVGPRIEEEGYASAIGRGLERLSEMLSSLGA